MKTKRPDRENGAAFYAICLAVLMGLSALSGAVITALSG